MTALPQMWHPTLNQLNAAISVDLDAHKVASEWFTTFASSVEAAKVPEILSHLSEDAAWRDCLSITFDFRTFYGSSKIETFLHDRIPNASLKAFKLESAELNQFTPTLAWIQGLFNFEVGELGVGTGIFRLVPTSEGGWKARGIFTNLNSLKNFPEQTGRNRDPILTHGLWEEARRREREFLSSEPYVVIIGGDQCGLTIAARLTHLDVPTLILEKSAKIGDNWRFRYEDSCLHDPVWFQHMPYLPFPSTWPKFAPAQKFADWLECYAHTLELNVWLSSDVTSIRKDPKTNLWDVFVVREGQERVLHPTHVVMAMGLYAGSPYVPDVPGKENFRGEAFHSSQHKTAKNYAGKKVVVIGSGTSGHDVSFDCVNQDVDVTMYQRFPVYVVAIQTGCTGFCHPYAEDGPPVEIADRVVASLPFPMIKMMHQGLVQVAVAINKDLLDGLKASGFKFTSGHEGSGLFALGMLRNGGYYINVGASEEIVKGNIKLKSDAILERFTENGLRFNDGSELAADCVIFATGYSDIRGVIGNLFGEELLSRVKGIGGLDEEGEMKAFWRDSGVENLWFATGNIMMARPLSKFLALQIKAKKEGLFGEKYSL